MALTNERAEVLAKYLTDKKDDGFAILDLEAAEAAAKINADGYDFTAEELKEFADLLQKSAAGDELDESSLDDVSGGIVPVIGTVIICGAVALAVAGYNTYKRSKKRK